MRKKDFFSNYKFAEHCSTAADIVEDVDQSLFDFSIKYQGAFRRGQADLFDSIREHLYQAAKQFRILANVSRSYNDAVWF